MTIGTLMLVGLVVALVSAIAGAAFAEVQERKWQRKMIERLKRGDL